MLQPKCMHYVNMWLEQEESDQNLSLSSVSAHVQNWTISCKTHESHQFYTKIPRNHNKCVKKKQPNFSFHLDFSDHISVTVPPRSTVQVLSNPSSSYISHFVFPPFVWSCLYFSVSHTLLSSGAKSCYFLPQCPYGQVNVKDPAKRKL